MIHTKFPDNTRNSTPPCLSLPNLLLWSVINKLTCNGGR